MADRVIDARGAFAAMRSRAAAGENCWCGQAQGHGGWLTCLEYRALEDEIDAAKIADREGDETISWEEMLRRAGITEEDLD